MESQKYTRRSESKDSDFHFELSNLCEKCLKGIENNTIGEIIIYSRCINKVVTQITSKALGKKAFLILNCVSEYFFSIADYKNCLLFNKSALYLSNFLECSSLTIKTLLLKAKAKFKLQEYRKSIKILLKVVVLYEKLWETNDRQRKNHAELAKIKIFQLTQSGKKAENEGNFTTAYEIYCRLCDYYSSLLKNIKKPMLLPDTKDKKENSRHGKTYSMNFRTGNKKNTKNNTVIQKAYIQKLGSQGSKFAKYFSFGLEQTLYQEKQVNTSQKRSNSLQSTIIIITPPETPQSLLKIDIKANNLISKQIIYDKETKAAEIKVDDFEDEVTKKKTEENDSTMMNEDKQILKRNGKLSFEVPRFKFREWKKNDLSSEIKPIKPKIVKENEELKAKYMDYIKKCIKIQAFVRGCICREKYKILKKSTKPIKIATRFISDVIFHIKIYEKATYYLINAYNGLYTYKVEVSKEKSLSSLVPNLFLTPMGLVSYNDLSQSISNNFKPIKSLQCIVNNERLLINFSINCRNKSIKLDYSQKGTTLSTILNTKQFPGISSASGTQASTKTFTSGKAISETQLDYCINHYISNYLRFSNNQLSHVYPKVFTEKEFLYRVSMKISKIDYQITLYKLITLSAKEMEIYIENLTNSTSFYDFFSWDICEKHLKSSKDFNDCYFLIILALEITENTVVVKNARKEFSFMGSVKRQIGKNDYLLRFFEYKTNKYQYLFECINYDQPNVTSIVESQGKIKKSFGLAKKKIKENHERILSHLRIKDEKLCFIDTKNKSIRKLNPSMTLISSVIKLQKVYRGKADRDRVKLLKSSDSNLLYSDYKSMNNTLYLISIFKLETNLLVQVYNTISHETVYKYIENPTNYVSNLSKFSDLPKILQAIRVLDTKIVITRSKPDPNQIDPNNSFFIEGPFIYTPQIKQSKLPILLQKNLNNCNYIIHGNLDSDKNLIATLISLDQNHPSYTRTFTPTDIIKIIGINDPGALLDTLRISYGHVVTSEVFTLSVPANVEELLGLAIIYKTCFKVSDCMYVICASLHEDLNDYVESELHFYARLTSSLEKCRKASIKLNIASERSGIAKSFPVSIAEYISRHMIVITLDEFYIDCSRPPVDFNKFATKIQSLIRGYRTRKLINIKLNFIFHEYFKVSDTTFCFMIYTYKKSYFISAVKGTNCFKIELSPTFIKGFFEASMKKQFVLNEIVMNLTYDGQTMRFTQDFTKKARLRRQSILETGSTSMVPNLLNTFQGGILRENTKEILITTIKIAPNNIQYLVRIYEGSKKYLLEVANVDGNTISSKNMKKEVIDFEAFVKKIHVDANRNKFYIEKRSLFNEICVITQKKVSLIIYEHKNGFYLDAYLLESKKPYHFFLGESIRVHSVLSRLKISNDGKGDKLVLSDF